MALVGSDRRDRTVVLQVALEPPPPAEVAKVAKQIGETFGQKIVEEQKATNRQLIAANDKLREQIRTQLHKDMVKAVKEVAQLTKQAISAVKNLTEDALAAYKKFGKENTEAAKQLKEAFETATSAWQRFAMVLGDTGVLKYALQGATSVLEGAGHLMQEARNLMGEWSGEYDVKRERASVQRELEATKMRAAALGLKTDLPVEGPEYRPWGVGKRDAAKKRGGGRSRNVDFSAIDSEMQGQLMRGELSYGPAMTPEDIQKQRDAELAAMMGAGLGAGGMDSEVANYTKRLQDQLDAAGVTRGGLMELMVFGEDGVDGFQELMQSDQEYLLTMFGELQAAATDMQGALAQSLGAAATGTGSFRKVLADQLKALGTAMSTRAYWHMLEELAMGWRASANPLTAAEAAAHFKAAAGFAAVGTAVGIGTRAAVGALSGGGGGSGGTTVTQRGSGFGSGERASRGRSEEQAVTINQFVFPGGEAEAGRRVQQALDAHHAKKGRAN